MKIKHFTEMSSKLFNYIALVLLSIFFPENICNLIAKKHFDNIFEQYVLFSISLG